MYQKSFHVCPTTPVKTNTHTSLMTNGSWLSASEGQRGALWGGGGDLQSTWPLQGKPLLLHSLHPGTQAQGCRPSRRVSEARNPDFYVKSPYL